MVGGCGAEPRASQYGGAAPGGVGTVRTEQNSQKTPKNSQDFDLKRVKTPKKGNFSTRNSQELYAEWNSLPFGFFVSYLCVWKRDDTHAWDTQNTFWSPLA